MGATGIFVAANPFSIPGRPTEATLLVDLVFAADWLPLAAIPLPTTGAGTDGVGTLWGGSVWRRELTTGVGVEATNAGGVTLELAEAVGAGREAGVWLGAAVGLESPACDNGCDMMALGALLGCNVLVICRVASLILVFGCAVLGCADGMACAGAGLRSIARL